MPTRRRALGVVAQAAAGLAVLPSGPRLAIGGYGLFGMVTPVW